MNLKWVFVLSIATLTQCYPECPGKCICNLDVKGRIQTTCSKGGMKEIPIQEIDPKVEVLIIRGPKNDITVGPIFGTFKKLEILRITDSNVPSVGTHSFWGVPSLRVLDLSRNNLTTIQDKNFRGQEKLEELDLSHNKIDRMASWVFHHLTDLRRLNLAHNSIRELVQRVFYMLNKLKYLDLSENPLIDLPPDVFKDITDLKELKCRRCYLKEINPNVFHLLPRLMELDLGENNLKYIDEGDFKDLKRLTKLRLNGNQLCVIGNNLFPSQKSLEHLDLSHNRLTKITNGALENLSNLTSLDVSYNKLMKLNAASMVPLKKLQSLNISGNAQIDLFKIRPTFNELRQLKTLAIADMRSMPMDLLHSFDQLNALNLSGNNLLNTSLALLDSVESLELLDLSRNHLTGFDDTLVLKLQQIRDVKLENNTLICDRCHMGTLIDIARLLHWNIYPICYLPEALRDAPISDLGDKPLDSCIHFIDDYGQLDAASTSENILLTRGTINLLAVICAVAFITIMIIILIAALSMTRHSAKYYTHEEKRNEVLSYEKNMDSLSINGNELSFKFPIDDVHLICTIDEMMLHHPLSTSSSPLPRKSTTFSKKG